MTTAYYILIPQFTISFISWIQLILSMNRFRGVCMFTRTDMWAFIVFLHAGFVRWIAALATHSNDIEFQFIASLIGSTLSWISFVVVFNEGFQLPSRQQWWALLMLNIITSLWEVNNRLILQL